MARHPMFTDYALADTTRGSLARRAGRFAEIDRVIPVSAATPRAWTQALRLHHWVKNLLVLLPALLADVVLFAAAQARGTARCHGTRRAVQGPHRGRRRRHRYSGILLAARLPDVHLPESGYSAVAVLALYINSPDSQALYHHHRPLWLICPLLLYWMSRAWSLTARGRMHDDPVVFAVRDPASLITLALVASIAALSI